MTRVTYQSVLGGPVPSGSGVYVRLGTDAIDTRRRDARRDVTVLLSKPQSRWMKDAIDVSSTAIDEGVIIRALVDLGMSLDLDWPLLTTGQAVRAAIRESVMVRRTNP